MFCPLKFVFPNTAPSVSHLCVEYILTDLKEDTGDGQLIGIDHIISLGE